MNQTISSQIVISHNNTMETCKRWLEPTNANYRPAADLVASRNAHLHNLMNYSHSPLY